MGLRDVVTFDFMSPPAENAIKDALQQLVLLQAVDSVQNQKVKFERDHLQINLLGRLKQTLSGSLGTFYNSSVVCRILFGFRYAQHVFLSPPCYDR